MRVLITGGAGFLGSHLAERHLRDGHDVLCLDNLLTGSTANVDLFFGNPRYQFIRHDVTNYIYVPGPVDRIYHFASPASPKDYLDYPIQTMKVGSLGTLNALGLAKAKGARFLLASTSEVYGDPEIHPQVESYWGNVNPVGPRGVYDESKRFGEALTMAYHRAHGVSTRIARIFNTYGPRMRAQDGRALPNFISQALKGEGITVYGDGRQTRSFCYVDDLIEGLLRLMESTEVNPVNIGNPEEISILDIAREVIDLTGGKSKLTYHELPQDDPKVRQPDISRARSLLGWEPKISRREGLARTVEFFRGRLNH